MERHSKAEVLGLIMGLGVFLCFALLPSLVYGGYAGLLLAGGIFGVPVVPTVLARCLVAFGMILGCISIASVFSVFGACLGALVGTLSGLSNNKKEGRCTTSI